MLSWGKELRILLSESGLSAKFSMIMQRLLRNSSFSKSPTIMKLFSTIVSFAKMVQHATVVFTVFSRWMQ